MKCSNCGNIISDNADFCPVCGERTSPVPYDNSGTTFRQRSANGAQPKRQQEEPVYEDEYEQQEAYADQETYYDDEEDAEPRSNRAMIGILIAMGVIIIILVIVLIGIIFKNKNTNTPVNTQVTTTAASTSEAASTLPGQTTAPAGTPGTVTTLPGASVVVTTAPGATTAVATTVAPTASPTEGLTPGNYVVSTSGDNLNIRKGQGTEYDKIGSIPNGTAVTAYSNGGSWAYVTYGGVSGWVSTQYLKAVAG
ncbi:MAG: SH3 domain-containing protein [Clostridia bacterium]|nr:SH3 domain-containing protein [Clostridia bacterium]